MKHPFRAHRSGFEIPFSTFVTIIDMQEVLSFLLANR
jgi:hypothetical protein